MLPVSRMKMYAFEQEIDTFQTAEIDIKECFTNSYNHKAEASLKVS